MRKPVFKFILFCLTLGGTLWPVSAFCTTPTHTTETKPSSLISDSGYQLAKIWFLPDWQSDTRSYNTSSGSNDKGGGDAEKTCETYGFASPGSVDLSLYDCSDYDIKPLYGLECYTGCVCKPKFQYDDDNCDIAAGYALSGSSCGGKYESCVCSGECCSDDMCGSNQSCVNNVCEDNCAALPSGWQELPCADADLQADAMDNECGGYYYKCLTPQEYCENQGYDKDSCDNGVVQDTCDKDGSYVKCQECNVMKAGWQETPCSDPDLQSGKEDNGCGGYYYQCMSTGEYCESKGFKKQECEAGEEATVCDKDSSYKTCACVPLSDEDNCSWGTKNCDNACGGTRSCCKTAVEYCKDKGYAQQICTGEQIKTVCEADSSYVKCETNPDCQVTPVTVPANGYCSTTNSCDICTGWECNDGYQKDGNACAKICKTIYPAVVGAIYNSDGTFMDQDCIIENKIPIGVVAYMNGGRRFVVALTETAAEWGGDDDVSCLANMNTSQAQSDFNGAANTQCLINDSQSRPAAEYCNTYKPVSSGIGSSGWYLPAAGELRAVSFSYETINLGLQKLSKTQLCRNGNYYWSSSEPTYAKGGAWVVRPYDGYLTTHAKIVNNGRVRCVLAF